VTWGDPVLRPHEPVDNPAPGPFASPGRLRQSTTMTTTTAAPRTAAPRTVGDLRPNLDLAAAVLTRRCGDVQVGWSPDRALLVRPAAPGGTATLATLLRCVDGVRTLAELLPLAAAAGFDPPALDELLAALATAGLVRWTPPPGTEPRRRALVHGRGPLTDVLVDGLRAAGLQVHRAHGRGPDGREVDLVLLCDQQVADPCLLAALVAARTPHLVVRLRDGAGLVGPLVLPGRSSCVRCADLHRSELDPEWPALAAQLMGRTGHGSPAVVRATAALALGQVEHLLRRGAGGEGAPGSLGATLELDLRTDTLRRRPWSPHPRCGCGAHP
jgi:bacteriocin biosynthesis cyclodehydratase domain-containing protein